MATLGGTGSPSRIHQVHPCKMAGPQRHSATLREPPRQNSKYHSYPLTLSPKKCAGLEICQLFFNKGNLSYREILPESPRHLSAVKLMILPQLLVILTTCVLLEGREHVCVFHRCVADTQKSISQIVDVINVYSVWKRKRLDHSVPLRHQTITDHLLWDRTCSQCSGNNDEQTHHGLAPICSKSSRKGT